MNFIKQHWFNLLIALIIIFFMSFTLLVSLSPREDAQKRGFIPCTESLAQNVADCGGKIWCAAKAVMQNGFCDLKIIGNGFNLWIKGEQPHPWSNYFFTPEPSDAAKILYENSELFYDENPNFQEDFAKVKQDYKKLEETNNNDQNADQ